MPNKLHTSFIITDYARSWIRTSNSPKRSFEVTSIFFYLYFKYHSVYKTKTILSEKQ